MSAQVASICIRLFGALLAVGQTVLLARLLGAAELGIYSGVLALTATLSIPISAGLPSFLTREVAKANASQTRERVRALIRTTNILALLVSFLSMVLLAVVYVGGWVGDGSLSLLVASCLLIPLLGLDLLRTGAMRGLGSALLSQLPENVFRPGGFLLLVGTAWISGREIQVVDAVWAFVASAALSAVIGNVMLRRGMRRIDYTNRRVSMFEVARGSAGLIAFGGVNTAIANIDILILTLGGFWVASGNYRVALLGVVALLIVYNAVADVSRRDFATGLAAAHHRGVVEASDRVVKYGSISVGMVALTYCIFGSYAIEILFGREYAPAYAALVIVSFGHLGATLVGPSFELAMAFDKQRTAVRINLLSLLVICCVSLSLLSWNPLLAVAIGSAMGNICRRGLLAIHVHRVLSFDTSVVGATRRRLGVVDGRSSRNVTAWLRARSQAWLDRWEVVAIDPSATFRNAIRQVLPAVDISVDHFHLVKLGNQMLTDVRQRAIREVLGRRGRKQDAVWAHRMLLLRAGDRLTEAGFHRLGEVLDEPAYEQVASAWAVKEHLRKILNAPSIAKAQNARIGFELAVAAAGLPEADRLSLTVANWWVEIKVFIRTRVTNARTEAANTAIKQIKRTGRGYRNQTNYQSRILGRSFRRTRRRSQIHPRAGLHAQV